MALTHYDDPLTTSYVKIAAGTGTFATVSDSNKVVFVQPGETLYGSISMGTYNGMVASDIAPLIGTMSWGAHSASYWTIDGHIATGTNTYTSSDISITAPISSGTYYLIFAFNAELNGAQVASSTNWRYVNEHGSVVWDDGNDVAGLSATKIGEMQSNGRTTVDYQFEFGKQQWTMPGDAVRIVVSDPDDYPSPFTNSHVRVQSGTGSFASISSATKEIVVEPGTALTGAITVEAKNDLAPGSDAPLICTYSWGAHSTSYWTVRSPISSGTMDYTTSGISIVAPQTEGTYHLIFSFGAEDNGAQVASFTNWRNGGVSWDDGEDLVDLSAAQISQAQSYGRTTVDYLFDTGYQQWVLPVDAITVRVDGLTHYDDPLTSSYVKVQSGTGSFASITPNNKRVVVEPGATLSGSITMTTKNDLASTDIAPLIGTTSWGAHSTSYWTVNSWISTGTGSYTSNGIAVTAPRVDGTYYLIFAFNAEKNGAQVASCTNWRYVDDHGSVIWDDGNDVAGLSNAQISEARSAGSTTVTYRFQTWTQEWTVPADAIEVVVGTGLIPGPDPDPPEDRGYISGTIIEDGGEPISGVTVTLSNGYGTISGSNGNFFFDITEGSYVMVLSKDGFEDREIAVSVIANETQQLSVVLDKVIEQENSPLDGAMSYLAPLAIVGLGAIGVIAVLALLWTRRR